MDQLYIHIGTHKTGTTAIQRALRAARVPLGREGMRLLQIPQRRALWGESVEQPEALKKQEAYLNNALKNTDQFDKALMSWEGYSGCLQNGYRNATRVAERLGELAGSFSPIIIVYLRRQDSFVESAYTQMISEGETYTFETFLSKIGEEAFDWYEHVMGYASVFGEDNVVVRTYDKDRLREAGGLLHDFSDILEIDSLRTARGRDVTPGSSYTPNAGFDPRALEAFRICNKYLTTEERSLFRKILKESSTKKPHQSYSYFDDERRREFMAAYEATNQRVADTFLDSRDSLFSEPQAESTSVLKQDGTQLEEFILVLARGLIRTERREPYTITLLRELEERFIRKLEEYPKIKQSLIRLVRRFVGYL